MTIEKAQSLGKALGKEELLEALEDSYKLQEQLYDQNLDRMTELHEQIEALKDNNKNINKRMKDLADKIREVAAK
jgi:hypothetical protein